MLTKRTAGKRLSARQAMVTANKHILFHYPTMFTGGTPRRLVLTQGKWWIVPIVLTHPEHGILGETGVVAVDGASGEIVGSSPRKEVVAAGTRLRKGKGYESEAAILPARTL